jgi:hypothetical protein
LCDAAFRLCPASWGPSQNSGRRPVTFFLRIGFIACPVRFKVDGAF